MGGNFNDYKEPDGDDVTIKQGDQVDANGDPVKYAPGRAGSVKGLLATGKKKSDKK